MWLTLLFCFEWIKTNDTIVVTIMSQYYSFQHCRQYFRKKVMHYLTIFNHQKFTLSICSELFWNAYYNYLPENLFYCCFQTFCCPLTLIENLVLSIYIGLSMASSLTFFVDHFYFFFTVSETLTTYWKELSSLFGFYYSFLFFNPSWESMYDLPLLNLSYELCKSMHQHYRKQKYHLSLAILNLFDTSECQIGMVNSF